MSMKKIIGLLIAALALPVNAYLTLTSTLRFNKMTHAFWPSPVEWFAALHIPNRKTFTAKLLPL